MPEIMKRDPALSVSLFQTVKVNPCWNECWKSTFPLFIVFVPFSIHLSREIDQESILEREGAGDKSSLMQDSPKRSLMHFLLRSTAASLAFNLKWSNSALNPVLMTEVESRGRLVVIVVIVGQSNATPRYRVEIDC